MPNPFPNTHKFLRQAMSTRFRIYIAGEEPRYSQQAADAAFDELARLEALLSRFREGSDVRRLNRLAKGESARVSPETFACLKIAETVRKQTGGAFDVAYASSGREASVAFALESDTNTIHSTCGDLEIDLGGIGKGFALDRMARVLSEWDVTQAFLSAGSSTHLAMDPPPEETGWRTEFGPDDAPRTHVLNRSAFSASGTARRGPHVINPKTGKPAETRIRAWASAKTAAEADALSTAFFILPKDKIEAVCRRKKSVGAWLEDVNGNLCRGCCVRLNRIRRVLPRWHDPEPPAMGVVDVARDSSTPFVPQRVPPDRMEMARVLPPSFHVSPET